MDNSNIPRDIISVTDRIAEKFHPEKIYLFSNKRADAGKTAGFKLCVVVDCNDIEKIERQIYLEVDSEVPYDIIIHSAANFEELCGRKGSFVQKIVKNGVLVYG